MIAKILPSLNLPTNIKTDVFSYLIPQKVEDCISVGQIVEIEFRNRKTQGVILEISKEETNKEEIKKLKSINKIIQSEYKITQNQLDIIDFISSNYFVSKSKALKTVIYELPKNKSKKTK